MNQNFLVKFVRILVEIIGLLFDAIFLIKSIGILIFTRITLIIISIRILVDLNQKILICPLSRITIFNSTRLFFEISFFYQRNDILNTCNRFNFIKS